MSRTIIVPLDTSPASEAALPVAEALARGVGGELYLLSVIEAPAEFAVWLRAEETIEGWVEHHINVDQYLTKVAERYSDVLVETQVSTGSPAPEIVASAREASEPVIVMASEARTGLPRMALGSVASAVLHSAPCPVVVVRAGEEPREVGPLDRLLVALDGSEFAEQALSAAQSVLGASNLNIHLVRVVETSKWYGSTYAELDYTAWDLYIKAAEESAREYIEEIAAQLDGAGHDVTWEVRDGLVAEQISTAAREHNAGLIVMATHGRTGLGRVLIGSVAERVIHDSELPVLLVNPAADR